MHVRKSLQISVGFSIVGILMVALMLSVVLHRVRNAMEGAEIAGKITNAVFERSAFINDYLQNDSQRAKRQWLAEHEQIRSILLTASEKEWDPEEKHLVAEMVSNSAAVGKLFAAVVAAREQAPPRATGVDAPEIERRLLTQLTMRTYETVLHARRLQEASRAHLVAVARFAGWTILTTLAVVMAAVLLTAWNISRTVNERVARLRTGAAAIGGGNLSYRIGLHGNDEFVELSRAFDEMAEKLSL